MHKAQRLINHVVLALDSSSSMEPHGASVPKVAEGIIRHLLEESEKRQQETRVSVYTFDTKVSCLIFDMDVMRVPSIADLYRTGGRTALLDAVDKSQRDLATTSQVHGDHSFLTFVLTDGEEYGSVILDKASVLPRYTTQAPENWTVAFFVPDEDGVARLCRWGAPKDCIKVWNANDAVNGVLEVGKTIQKVATDFMEGRANGVRGSKSVFSVAATGANAVNAQTVEANLTPLDKKSYSLHDVPVKTRIDEFVTNTLGKFFVNGKGYYQFTKKETIQCGKSVIVVNKKTRQAFGGWEARKLIGLPDGIDVKVQPDANPDYDIFVQSTMVNRNLMPGTKLLLLLK